LGCEVVLTFFKGAVYGGGVMVFPSREIGCLFSCRNLTDNRVGLASRTLSLNAHSYVAVSYGGESEFGALLQQNNLEMGDAFRPLAQAGRSTLRPNDLA